LAIVNHPVIVVRDGKEVRDLQLLYQYMFRSAMWAAAVMLIGLIGNPMLVEGQAELPPCAQRATMADPPWVNGQVWCLEHVVDDDSAGELGYTALAAAPDGTLYAARPLAGEVLALTDTNGDGLPDTPRVVAQGLTLPNGLAYYKDALYISGGAHIYRLVGDRLDVLVDDLPAAGGFWTGGLTVGPDERIYVGIGAPCDYCEPADPQRGAIWSFALDGSDKQVVATGLRQPSDVVFRDGVLWTIDTARDGLDTPNLDELDRVVPGAQFGWPYCIGADNHPDSLGGRFDCGSAAPPALTFPTHSNPLGMTVYESDTFPGVKGDLLVTLGGASNQVYLQGFTLVAVAFDPATGAPSGYHVIIPEQGDHPIMLALEDIHYQGSGFWPHHPLDVTVSPEGWIYVSEGGGRIFALRPHGD
jgi:glucose/arabinose dehydrogenase